MDALRSGDPDRVGGYLLLGRLGEGGMGQVYLGRSAGGRPVAVKLVHPQYGSDPDFRRRFAVEVEAARRVGGFYTAHVVDADPQADRPWLVTAYVPGPSLQEAVAEHGPLSAASVSVLGAGLAEGLAAIHGCGLVHRDLKPENVILAADGPRVIDFGVARALEASSGTATGIVAGTPAYMSPEQARGDKEIGPASDVFSLGSVLAFAACGITPFGHGHPTAVLYRVAREEPDLDQVPGGLRDLVAACLAKAPVDRPAVADLLRQFADRADPADAWPPPAVHVMLTATAVNLGSLAPAPAPVPPPRTEHDSTATPPPSDATTLRAPYQSALPASAGPPRRRHRRPLAWGLGGAVAVAALAAIVAVPVAMALHDDKTGKAPSAPSTLRASASASSALTPLHDSSPSATSASACGLTEGTRFKMTEDRVYLVGPGDTVYGIPDADTYFRLWGSWDGIITYQCINFYEVLWDAGLVKSNASADVYIWDASIRNGNGSKGAFRRIADWNTFTLKYHFDPAKISETTPASIKPIGPVWT